MEAPIPTVEALFKRLEIGMDDLDLFEHNEAFASASYRSATISRASYPGDG